MFPWTEQFFSVFDDACIIAVKVCAVTAQPGQTKELQSVQLERSLHSSTRQGVIFEDDDSIQGQRVSSVLQRNAIKPEDVEGPISVSQRSILSCRASRPFYFAFFNLF